MELATRAGLYVLVNYHDVGRVDLDHCHAFWRLVAGRYADRTNVIYELANEPGAWFPGDWDETAVAAQRELLATVRARRPTPTSSSAASPTRTTRAGRTIADVAAELGVEWSNASLGFHPYRTGGTSAPIVAARERPRPLHRGRTSQSLRRRLRT